MSDSEKKAADGLAHFARMGEALRAAEEEDRRRAAERDPGEKILTALRWSDALANGRDAPPEELAAQGTLRYKWERRRRS